MRIAIIGTGISGLTCAYLLHSSHDITVFEADSRIGGHSNTIDVTTPEGLIPVDTGFIVFNRGNYPNFCRLMERLGVASHDSPMSFSVRCERTGFEYSGASIPALFARRRNLLDPGFYRMLADIVRFGREAPALLEESGGGSPLLGEYLREHRYSRRFVEHYLVPMGAAIWSASTTEMQRFPARHFVRFFHNHGMLNPRRRPQWRTMTGGSRVYVDAISRPFRDRVRLGTPVRSITRAAGHVDVASSAGVERFDQVIIAAHSDQALRMLADASAVEREILGALPYSANEAVLHTDRRMLPRRRGAWAAWNYHLLDAPDASSRRVALTYSMNILQSLPTRTQVCVTLNRTGDIDPAAVIATIKYDHPMYTQAGFDAQARHAEISGVNRTHFCGAYWRWGFHEDGVVSALRVCERFGVSL